MQKVFVVDKQGKPLLPCHPARARKLLKQEKAKVVQVVPFTIQLNYTVDNPVGSFKAGVDDGSKYTGVAIVNDKTNEVVFKGQINLRQDVKRLMEQRRNYRRFRRSRKLRYRQPRFNNRRGCKIPPSIQCRKESILRFLRDMMKRINITDVVVEEVKFNHAKYRWGKQFSLVEQGKNYLRKQILDLGLSYGSIFGYDTKVKRLNLGLSKKHSNDAISIVCVEKPIINSFEWIIKPRRTKVWGNNPTKTCEERNGFKHYDLVKAVHRTRGVVIGSVRSLKVKAMTLRTKWDDNFPVSYNKASLLQRFDGLVYIY
ncbi:MAG: HNH endonuclease [Chloroflexi bacterium]|nr:MAG: HNH endonuclease [Chloroflexota bacterium]